MLRLYHHHSKPIIFTLAVFLVRWVSLIAGQYGNQIILNLTLPDVYYAFGPDLIFNLTTYYENNNETEKSLLQIYFRHVTRKFYSIDYNESNNCMIQIQANQTEYRLNCNCLLIPGIYEILSYKNKKYIWTNKRNKTGADVLAVDRFRTFQHLNVLRPPEIKIRIPYEHRALYSSEQEEDVKVKIDGLSTAINCPSVVDDPDEKTKYFLQIWFLDGKNGADTNGTVVRKITHGPVNIRSSDQLKESIVIPLPCYYFDRAGTYIAALIFKNNQDDIVIAESNRMRVRWFDNYRLGASPAIIFPCSSAGVTVTLDRPSCGTGLLHSQQSDRIRLYGILRNTAKPPDYQRSVYIGEQTIKFGQSIVDFGCHYFDLIYFEYCFVLVTVFEDGLTVEHARRCLSTMETRYAPVDGHWSSWRSWGPCTTSCGVGVRHRLRLCNNPSPKYYGKFCNGNGVEYTKCNSPACPVSRVDFNYQNRSISSSIPCRCGCVLTKDSDVIVIDRIGRHHHETCGGNRREWSIISPQPSFNIWLKFLSIDNTMVYNPNQRLIIKEYFSSDTFSNDPMNSRSLFDSSYKLANGRKVIRSTSNHVRIEFLSKISIETAAEGEKEMRTIRATKKQYVIIKYKFLSSNLERVQLKGILDDQMLKLICYAVLPCLFGLIVFCILAIFVWKFLMRTAKRRLLIQLRHQSVVSSDFKEHSSINDDAGFRLKADLRMPSDDESLQRKTVRDGIEDEPLLRKKPQMAAACMPKIPEEMFISTLTQSTRLSAMTQHSNDMAENSPRLYRKSCRSIGIQLSSPPLILKRRCSFGSKTSVATTRDASVLGHHALSGAAMLAEPGSPNPSVSVVGTDQDFEYDYSEFAVPGSMLNPTWNLNDDCQQQGAFSSTMMRSDISIDDIIGQCELMIGGMNHVAPKSVSSDDPSTQMDNLAPTALITDKPSISTQIQTAEDDFLRPEPTGSNSKLSSDVARSKLIMTKQFHFL